MATFKFELCIVFKHRSKQGQKKLPYDIIKLNAILFLSTVQIMVKKIYPLSRSDTKHS